MNMDNYVGYRDADGNKTPPLPKQVEATRLRDNHKDVLFAGSFGTGKSEWLVNEMIADLFYFPGNLGLTGRKRLSWFKSSTLLQLLDAIPAALMLKHDKKDHEIIIRSRGSTPSKLLYRQLDSSREALDEIKNMNLGFFAPDQCEELDQTVADAAAGRLRRTNSSRQFFTSCNPAGRNWVWKKWVDGGGGENTAYVESRMWTKGVPPPTSQEEVTFDVTDNPYLPYDYIRDLLEKYPENWLDRYVFCGWNDFEGLVYPMWRDEWHLCKPFDIPDWWYRIIALDHGHRNPTAIGWWALGPDGTLYLYDLHYVAGKWVDYHADILKIKSAGNGTDLEDVIAWPASPDIFSKQWEIPIAELYREHDIYWERANSDVAGGITLMAQYLNLDRRYATPQFPDGKPRMRIFDIPETRPFVNEIKTYCWEDLSSRSYRHNLPEKPRKKDDHAVEMARYTVNHVEESIKPPEDKRPRWLENRIEQGLTWMSV